MSACRDQNALGGDGAAFADDFDRVRVHHLGAAPNDGPARRLDAAAVELAEPGDFHILVGDQRFPVEALLADGPAIGARIVDGVAELACIDEQLLRHAAANHAGAAEAVFLGDGGANAKACRKPRGTDAA